MANHVLPAGSCEMLFTGFLPQGGGQAWALAVTVNKWKSSSVGDQSNSSPDNVPATSLPRWSTKSDRTVCGAEIMPSVVAGGDLKAEAWARAWALEATLFSA